MGIETTILKQIEERNSRHPERCKLEVFEFWLSNAPDLSWGALFVAVEALGTHTRLVRKLQSCCGDDVECGATLTAKPEAQIATNSDAHIVTAMETVATSNTENLYTKLQLQDEQYAHESHLKVETDKMLCSW